MPSKASVAIVGSGNISTDLMYKLLRSEWLEPRWMIGIDPTARGSRGPANWGSRPAHEGVDWLLKLDEMPDLIFEATSAYVHRDDAPRYDEAGIRAIDLTPAAVGPAVIPPVNLREHLDAPNVNMITCGGQATIPMVYAVSRVVEVSYAEIVASVSSVSAGPGTRANIDEFTKTTSKRCRDDRRRGARQGDHHPQPRRSADDHARHHLLCDPRGRRHDAIAQSIRDVVAEVQKYVPGYRLLHEPQFDEPSVVNGGNQVSRPSSKWRVRATTCRPTPETWTS